ncbi:MAG: Crp/Fnr family transcriptional regulator [Bacteroidales bacterium]|nr:Crp/Fnr family transcriptional regulator [Bacteroidales bacterium]
MRIPSKDELKKELLKTELAKLLSSKDIAKLESSLKFISYSKGENIFKQGATITEIAVLVKGLCKFTVENPSNAHGTIIGIKKPVSILGVSTLADTTYKTTAAAMNNAVVAFFNKQDFYDIIKSNPSCAYRMYEFSCNAIRNQLRQISELSQKSIRSRLACTLLNITQLTEDEDFIDLPISRNDLAECSGIATGSTIRLLSDFEKEGIVVLEKKTIKIKDKEKLLEISYES